MHRESLTAELLSNPETSEDPQLYLFFIQTRVGVSNVGSKKQKGAQMHDSAPVFRMPFSACQGIVH